MKLTKAQLACLVELSKPGACAHYMRYMGRFTPNPYWFMSTTMRKVTKQIEFLHKHGFINVKSEKHGDGTAIINGKGKAYVELA